MIEKFLEGARIVQPVKGGGKGKVWKVVMIEAGLSLNDRYYPAAVLIRAKHLFEDAKCFAYEFEGKFDHLPLKVRKSQPEGLTKNLVGFFNNVQFEKYNWQGQSREGLTANLNVIEEWFRIKLLNAWEVGKPDIIGFSIDGEGESADMLHQGKMIRKILELHKLNEVTAVTSPAAGGKVMRLVASRKPGGFSMADFGKQLYKLCGYLDQELFESLKEEELSEEAKVAELLDKLIEENGKVEEANAVNFSVFLRSLRDLIKDGQMDNAVAQIDDMLQKLAKYPYPAVGKYPYPYPRRAAKEEEERKEKESDPDPDPDPEPKPKPEAQESEKVAELTKKIEELSKQVEKSAETLTDVTESARKNAVRSLVTESGLPSAVQKKLSNQCEGMSEEDAKKTIETEREVLAELFNQKGAGVASARAEITESQKDKWNKAMDAMFQQESEIEGVPAFRGIRHAFEVITGRRDVEPSDILAESAQFAPTFLSEGKRKQLFESLATSDWPQVLGDSIHRQLIREYSLENLNTWRLIVSDIGNIKDFRDNPRVRYGGYGLLDVVGERDTYQSLTSPTDEEAKYKVQKRGGLEDLTIEMIANDDLGALRRIPQKMGRAAVLTLYQTIFNVLKDNPAIYDTVTLFHATHGNLGSTALASDALNATRQLMMQQSPYGISAERLGVVNAPKYIIVPPELEDEAWELTASPVVVTSNKDATIPNIHRAKYGVEYIQVSYWTDATDWVAVADPKMIPTIEVGFWNGRQEPELFVQDQPTVGSVFNSDKITYKIRHVWGYAVLDYRPFYKHVVAG